MCLIYFICDINAFKLMAHLPLFFGPVFLVAAPPFHHPAAARQALAAAGIFDRVPYDRR